MHFHWLQLVPPKCETDEVGLDIHDQYSASSSFVQRPSETYLYIKILTVRPSVRVSGSTRGAPPRVSGHIRFYNLPECAMSTSALPGESWGRGYKQVPRWLWRFVHYLLPRTQGWVRCWRYHPSWWNSVAMHGWRSAIWRLLASCYLSNWSALATPSAHTIDGRPTNAHAASSHFGYS